MIDRAKKIGWWWAIVVMGGLLLATDTSILTARTVIAPYGFKTTEGDSLITGNAITTKLIVGNPADSSTTTAKARISGRTDLDSLTAISSLVALGNSGLGVSGARLRFTDTTIASSVKRLVAVNLHDPAQVWSYDAFRAAETNTSLWRTDGTRVPDLAILGVSTAGDTLRWLDALNPSVTPVRSYVFGSNNIISGVAGLTDVAWNDGVITTGGLSNMGFLAIDELFDAVNAWTTAGHYRYNGALAARNSSAGWTLMSSSPALVNNTVNAVAAMRSPWPFHVDALGRRLQYTVTPTTGGLTWLGFDATGARVARSNTTGAMAMRGLHDHQVVALASTVLEAADAADNDQFCMSVSVSSDASVLAVGAQGWEGSPGTGRGGVYIYDWNGSAWVQRGDVLEADDAADDDNFGASISLSSDASVLAVGACGWEDAPGEDRGGVYIYDWSDSAWVQRGSVIEAGDAADGDYFGISISLSSDASVLAVGACGWEDAPGANRGGVYIYDWSDSAWVQRGAVIEAGDAADGDQFGMSVSVSSDALVMAVGANGWEDAPGTGRGGVYIYDWNGSAWVQRGDVLEADDAADDDQFGRSVSLSSDASVLAVGAIVWEGVSGEDRGGVYIYDWSGSAWVQRGSVIEAADAADGDYFGTSVSVSSDASVLAVGAITWEGASGANRGGVYATTTLSWRESALAITGDSWTWDQELATRGVPTERHALALLPGMSGSGQDAPRIMYGGMGGLTIRDLKVGDNTNGSRQEINNRYVSPVMHGNVMAAWAGGGTADVSGRGLVKTRADSSDLPTFTASASAPGSHYWTFNGTSDRIYVSDHDSLSFGNASVDRPFSISVWLKPSSGLEANRVIVDKLVAPNMLEWEFYLDGSGLLSFYAWDNSTGARIGRRWNTFYPYGGMLKHVVATYSGNAASSGFAIYIDGRRVDDTSGDYLSYTAMENTAAPVTIGSLWGGSWQLSFAGEMTNLKILPYVMTAEQMGDEYDRMQRFIQSPYVDTLLTANTTRVKVNQTTGDVMLVHPNSIEIRDKWGAVVKTDTCASCGTLADGDFWRIAGVDSLGGGYVFGGSTGLKSVIPDPRLVDLAMARYDYEQPTIGEAAVVDSAGRGDFWTVQDAIDAASNVGRRVVEIARGYLPNPVTSVPVGMTLRGSGPGTVIGNASSTDTAAVTVTGDSVTISGLTAYTAPGSAGGGKPAIRWKGAHGTAEDVVVRDSDDDGLVVTGRFFVASNLRIADADDRGVSIEAGRASLISPVFSSGGTPLVLTAAGDSSRVVGGDVTGNIHLTSGAAGVSITGTIYGALEDIGSGATEAGNP